MTSHEIMQEIAKENLEEVIYSELSRIIERRNAEIAKRCIEAESTLNIISKIATGQKNKNLAIESIRNLIIDG